MGKTKIICFTILVFISFGCRAIHNYEGDLENAALSYRSDPCRDSGAGFDFDDVNRKSNSWAAHGAITSDLFNGEIIEFKPFNKDGNQQTTFKVKIKSGDQIREAMFKPRVYGDADGWARAPMEYVAYYLNRKLHMDYVPPVAYRKGLNLEYNGVHYTEGAFLFFSPEYTPLANLHYESYGSIDEGVISDSRILNVLLQNKDAHNRNLGTGRHWVDGKTRAVFIDFGAGLRPGTNISITNFPVFGNSSMVYRIRRSTLDGLRWMNFESFRPLMEAGFINEGEAWQMDGIRHGMVQYFESNLRQIQAEGRPETDVIIPW